MGLPEQDPVAIEAIKALKARYFRLLDSKQWEAWGEVFTEDAVMDVSDDAPLGGILQGRDAIVKVVPAALRDARTIHHGHMPEIEITGLLTARGIWAMEDEVDFAPEGDPPSGIRGAGWYHEEYRVEDGAWRIASLRLERLRIRQMGDGVEGVTRPADPDQVDERVGDV